MKKFAILIILCGCFIDTKSTSTETDTDTDGSSSGEAEVGTASNTSFVTVVTTVSTSFTSNSETSSEESTGLAETSDSGSSTGTLETFYNACTWHDDSACGEDEDCIWTDGITEGITATGFCAQGCNEPADCPPPPEGSDAEVACTYYCDNVLRCQLRCPGGLTCPSGTQCTPLMQLPECAGTYVDVCT